jgi:hypothetical protein
MTTMSTYGAWEFCVMSFFMGSHLSKRKNTLRHIGGKLTTINFRMVNSMFLPHLCLHADYFAN